MVCIPSAAVQLSSCQLPSSHYTYLVYVRDVALFHSRKRRPCPCPCPERRSNPMASTSTVEHKNGGGFSHLIYVSLAAAARPPFCQHAELDCGKDW